MGILINFVRDRESVQDLMDEYDQDQESIEDMLRDEIEFILEVSGVDPRELL